MAEIIGELKREDIPVMLGEAERKKAELWMRLFTLAPTIPAISAGPDKMLTPQEAAAILNVTVSWLQRHAKDLPFAKRINRKTLRFSESGLRRWQSAKQQ